jgi:hypothetical protein
VPLPWAPAPCRGCPAQYRFRYRNCQKSNWLEEGGIPLLAIVALSVLLLAVSIERLVHFRAARVVPAGLAEQVLPLWEKGEFDAIEQAAAASDSTLGRVIGFIVAHRRHDYTRVSGGAGDIASMELRHHQQKFYALSIVATVAPIVKLHSLVIAGVLAGSFGTASADTIDIGWMAASAPFFMRGARRAGIQRGGNAGFGNKAPGRIAHTIRPGLDPRQPWISKALETLRRGR